MEEKMVVKTINGESYTVTGEVVNFVKDYFKNGKNIPLGWIAVNNAAINFAHVVSVEFITD